MSLRFLHRCYFEKGFQTIVRSNSNRRFASPHAAFSLHVHFCFLIFVHTYAQVAQRQGAKATLSPVPTHVLTMFERALDEQVGVSSALPAAQSAFDGH
jgi:hypothetical protein